MTVWKAEFSEIKEYINFLFCKNAKTLMVISMTCFSGSGGGSNDVIGRKQSGLVNNLNDRILENKCYLSFNYLVWVRIG